jgi:hypothetical protein
MHQCRRERTFYVLDGTSTFFNNKFSALVKTLHKWRTVQLVPIIVNLLHSLLLLLVGVFFLFFLEVFCFVQLTHTTSKKRAEYCRFVFWLFAGGFWRENLKKKNVSDPEWKCCRLDGSLQPCGGQSCKTFLALSLKLTTIKLECLSATSLLA